MRNTPYQPVYELTRGGIVESIHNGAIAVIDSHGNLLAWYGDPDTVTFLRSTAKPFQAMPFIEHGGHQLYGLTAREIALLCASHSGTDDHVTVVKSIQAKTGVVEADLLCGTHPPMHQPTAEALRERKEQLTSNRHNCSGKHTGMLAYVRMQSAAGLTDSRVYIDQDHPLQKEILTTFAEMCRLSPREVVVGIDGCSAPNFAVPLRSAALGYARLRDPLVGQVAPSTRVEACRTIAAAMTAHPDMVGGPDRFDTCLMQVTGGRVLSKAGAEGYQGLSIAPGGLGPHSPAVGIAIKIGDGDLRGSIGSAVALEVLRQLNALNAVELEKLAMLGPTFPVHNWRKLLVGEGRPAFQLVRP